MQASSGRKSQPAPSLVTTGLPAAIARMRVADRWVTVDSLRFTTTSQATRAPSNVRRSTSPRKRTDPSTPTCRAMASSMAR